MLSACGENQNNNANSKKTTELTISAAASLSDALKDVQKRYEKVHPNVKLHFNFGASGTLQQQISQGAPADLFFSAAEDKFNVLVKSGLINKSEGINLVGNEVVLVIPKDSDTKISSFTELSKPSIKKISIGTPEAVPAGAYAEETFKNMKLWDSLQPRLVYAKDVRQVLSYVETGNVDAGVVYKTDALISKKVKIVDSADPKTHSPIVYPVGIIKDTKHKKEAKAFYKYLQKPSTVKVLENYGFKKIS
ncbi:molybdate ABC transporter substrate-binding protein [Fictibacillus sp. NE201]|uniref:Molybdate ABC transporter substrate-binding protein n=1 Tax=Fictibacillus fluitans TaxID=3058422 RepID=A0ABT8HV27_9BACL|nr:molybdate ABC transporter substrate-binding protein [Fictibacillus sp. NE201]MDN4524624.1 molybdate ABC transporter substrate-binding protein [Fictibacillus sp. NE201]